jgi:hypothetical protein
MIGKSTSTNCVLHNILNAVYRSVPEHKNNLLWLEFLLNSVPETTITVYHSRSTNIVAHTDEEHPWHSYYTEFLVPIIQLVQEKKIQEAENALFRLLDNLESNLKSGE